ncbi:MAG: TonB-dependent receptor [Pelomonas sp.]|nr:TonB-dependent receptor [Roseateles sp.]
MKSRFRVPALTLPALAAALFCTQTFAQSADETGAQKLERVEVTGSNIKRTTREGASPIDIISAKQIGASGAATTLDVLKKLVPALGNDGYSDVANQNSFSRGVATASLRNLSATSTLILINGRRMTPSAYANPNNGTSTLYDLNSIPASAIERIEVLKDGASAVYGSDAVGGVINFITYRDFEGADAKISSSLNEHREYGKGSLSGKVGYGKLASQGFNLMLGADLSIKGRSMEGASTNPGIYADDYRALNLRQNPYGSSLASYQSPFFTRESAPGSKAFPQTNPANVINVPNCPASQQITGSAYYGITTQPLLGRTFCNYNLDQYNEMQNPGNDSSLLGHGTFDLGHEITAFTELGYSRSERDYLGAPRTISGLSPTTNFIVGGLAPSFQPILEIGNPDNPFTNARAAVQLRFDNIKGGYKTVNDGYRAVAGLRGTIADNWDWESALLWNRSHRDETYYGFLRLPVLRQMLGPQSGGTNRSIASIATDPDLSHPLLNQGDSQISQWDGKISGQFGRLPGGPIGVAAGFELRRESIRITPDPENAAGNVLGLATTAVTGGRTVESGFAELDLPAFKQLDLSLAGRLDKYPGIKTNFVPKVGFKYTPNSVVALRGTYAEGFRAPAVSQVSPGGAQFFVNGLQDPVRCNVEAVPPVPFPGAENADCNKSVSGVGGANPALKPEKSYSSSLGIVLSPMKAVDLVVGYYKIRKNGEVALGSAQDVIDHPDRYPPGALIRDTNPNLLLNGQPGTGPLIAVSTPWTNQGSTMVSGYDFEIHQTAMILQGAARWSNDLNGTVTSRYQRIEQPGYAPNNLVGTRGGVADWATSAPDVPRVKFRFTSTIEAGPHTIMGALNYVSGVSLIRREDGSTKPPSVYSGQTCQYGGTNYDGVAGRSIVGVAPTATNGRDLYINRYPGCAIAEWATIDVGYTYTGFKDLALGLNIQNLGDAKAPYDPAATYLGYNVGLHNPYGRYYTVSASYKFK